MVQWKTLESISSECEEYLYELRSEATTETSWRSFNQIRIVTALTSHTY